MIVLMLYSKFCIPIKLFNFYFHRNPVVCGITTLDYDHTSILGNTLPEIAWHKAGILKPGSVGITVGQSEEAIAVIEQRAEDRNCKLFKVPNISKYSFPEGNLENGLPGHHQETNLSLALQLARIWLERTGNSSKLSNFYSS